MVQVNPINFAASFPLQWKEIDLSSPRTVVNFGLLRAEQAGNHMNFPVNANIHSDFEETLSECKCHRWNKAHLHSAADRPQENLETVLLRGIQLSIVHNTRSCLDSLLLLLLD